MRAVSLLVLLCCRLLEGQSVSVNDTLSHYEGRENQIQAEKPRTEPPATTSTQQSCQPDLHSVLREMSAMLAELRVEQRHTTTAVNNMETRLRASESQTEELKKKVEIQSQINQGMLAELRVEQRQTTTAVNNMETRLRASDSQREELKKKVEEELKDLKTSFENQVENLKKENEAQSVNQSNMEVRFGTELEELRVKNDERKVVFSVGDGSGQIGPYSADVTLVFKHIFTNIGNAYNPVTGYFTAPVRGVYQFTFHINAVGGRSLTVDLYKNEHHVARTHSYQTQYRIGASNGVSLLLDVGDVVCLKLVANAWIYDDRFYHSTFSGQMLFSV